MPNLNGYDVARAIRKERWGSEVRLIALTGWGQEEDRRRAMEAGFDYHFTKPVDPDALQNLLAQQPVAPSGRGPDA
jgi:CheY-like chemotaxis protein